MTENLLYCISEKPSGAKLADADSGKCCLYGVCSNSDVDAIAGDQNAPYHHKRLSPKIFRPRCQPHRWQLLVSQMYWHPPGGSLRTKNLDDERAQEGIVANDGAGEDTHSAG